MDYEKKYKEALERAKIWKEKSGMPTDKQGILDDIFPELAESEDEKTRKELITHCRNTRCVTEEGAEQIAKWIAWLEKQGEKKSYDKVEPKFKVGDWIFSSVLGTAHIIGVNDSSKYYQLEYIDKFINIDYVNYEYDKWTIQDAKDGDVLAFYSEYNGNKIVQVGIIEKYIGKYGGCSNTFNIHVGVNWENNLQIGNYMGCHDIRPATKEQRDTLFSKMKEAGYEWNTEKKELKKIEQNPTEDSAKVSESSTEEKDMGEYKKGFECGKQRVLKYPEDFGLCKKAAEWNEEDEKHVDSASEAYLRMKIEQQQEQK